MNLANWLYRAAKAAPNKTAIRFGSQDWSTYRYFASRAARLAGALQSRLSIRKGDRIAIIADNCPQYLDIWYAIWWVGAVAVPVNAKLHGAEMAWIIENCGANVVFAGDQQAQALTSQNTSCEIISIGSRQYSQLLDADPIDITTRAPDDAAWLFYTSGTTGKPKGAVLTHRNLAAMSLAYLSDVDSTQPNDTLLHAAALSHGSGCYQMAHVARMAVNAIPESGAFEPAEIFECFNANPGTSMFAAPTMIKRLVGCPASVETENIRTIIWGGAPMHVADTLSAIDRFGTCFAQIYGQGETPMTTTVLPKWMIADRNHPDWLKRLGTAGIVNSAVEVRITQDADDEAGEVLVRGDTVMSGYWNNPQATASALQEGWLRTGDVGTMDADGFLTLLDRSKDMIISGGSNIYPREVEELLLQHPRVHEASVIGRTDPDWGEVVVAYFAGKAQIAELDRLCLDNIARFKRPKAYIRVEALPKNSYGKILKTELRAQDARNSKQSQN